MMVLIGTFVFFFGLATGSLVPSKSVKYSDCSHCNLNPHRPRNAIAATDVLKRYGYLKDSCSFNPLPHSYKQSILSAIVRFQEFNGLKITGRFDEFTLDQMGKSRCGVPDIIDDVKVTIVSHRRRGKRQSSVDGRKWEKNDLTYRVTSYTDDLTPGQTDAIIREAWKVWSDATPLTFTQVDIDQSDADMDISFVTGVHGDTDPFDGPGGVTGHAFFPGGPEVQFSGDTHFDDDENWTLDQEQNGNRLLCAAVHEFGHTLGLKHTNMNDSIMYPWTKECGQPKLSDYDIVLIQGIYGPNPNTGMTPSPNFNMSFMTEITDRLTTPSTPFTTETSNTQQPYCTTMVINKCTTEAETTTTTVKTTPVRMTTPTTTPSTTPTTTPSTTPTTPSTTPTTTPSTIPTQAPIIIPGCPSDGKLDAIDVGPDGHTYGFKGDKVYRFNREGIVKGYPKDISYLFPHAPSDIDAAISVSKSFFKPGRMYIFKGDRVWKYNYSRFMYGRYGYSLKRGYPKLIKDKFGIDVKNIDAVFKLKSKHVVFFAVGGKLYSIKFRAFGGPKHTGKPIDISFHPTLKHLKKIDAAVKWTDGAYYFFAGDYYYRLVPTYKTGLAKWYHPKYSLLYWFHCRIPGTEGVQRPAGDLTSGRIASTLTIRDI